MDRTYIVTGANTGIGRATAAALAAQGARVVLACRSEDKAMAAIASIGAETGNDKLEFVRLDLGELASVHACADALVARGFAIDGLINNAGLGGKGLTTDGFELHFGVNYLGHFLLTLRLLPRLLESRAQPARVVNVSSHAHRDVKQLELEGVRNETRSFMGAREYSVSKLGNAIFSRRLARRMAGRGVHSYALHPGVVGSDMWRRVWPPVAWLAKRFIATPAEGARTTLHCTLSEEAGRETGLYYDACRVAQAGALVGDEALADELWRRSLEWTGATDPT